MARHLRVTVEGKVYDVIVEEIETDDPGPQLSGHQAHLTMPVAANPKPAVIAASPSRSAASSANEKRAPLGGLILELTVHAGDHVKAGDKIAVIEAMKMKTNITAHQEGQITSVAVNVGDVVDAGQTLVTIG